MKANKLIYKILIIAGSIMTFSYIGTFWDNDLLKVILNIIAMIGSGVLCSALVSLFLELKSEKEKKKQSAFILEGIKNRLKILLFIELKSLSAYAILTKPNSIKITQKSKLKNKDIIGKINELLESITEKTESIYQYSIVIDSEYMEKMKVKNNLSYGHSLPYYNDLLSKISDLLINSNNYLMNGVFNENKVNVLKSMEIEIKEIIGFSNEDDLELLMEFKQMFFKNITTYFKAFDINLDEEQDCYMHKIREY